MDIVVIGSSQLKNEDSPKQTTRTPARKGRSVDRRRNRTDRRRSVRDGIVVSLSHRKERRRQPDRRQSDDG